MKQRRQSWITYGKQQNRSYVFYEDLVIDVTQFASIHPGGKAVLTPYLYTDITDVLFEVFPHKESKTLNILFSKVVGKIGTGNKGQFSDEKNEVKNKHHLSKLNLKVSFQKKDAAKLEQPDGYRQETPILAGPRKSFVENKREHKNLNQKSGNQNQRQLEVKGRIRSQKQNKRKKVENAATKSSNEIGIQQQSEQSSSIKLIEELKENKFELKFPILKPHFMNSILK